MNRRTFASLFVSAAVAAFAAGCNNSSSGTATTSPAPSEASPSAETSGSPSAGGSAAAGGAIVVPGGAVGANDKIILAFVTNNPSDYWTIARRGTEKAAKELPNVDVQFEIPANGTAAEQKTIIDNLLAKGCKGLAISPVDPQNQIQLINDTAKKAIVFTQDSDAATSDRMCYVGTDNIAAGTMAGEALKKALPDGGTVMVFVGKKDAQNAKDRYDGLAKAIAGTKIKILDERTDDADHARAKANAADALVKYPDLAAMVGLWSYNGPAIVSAVKEAGKVGKVKIVAFDEEADTLSGVRDGSIVGTVVQQPFEFGYRAIKMMNDVARGKTMDIPANHMVNIPTRLITKDNVDEFETNLNKLRGK